MVQLCNNLTPFSWGYFSQRKFSNMLQYSSLSCKNYRKNFISRTCGWFKATLHMTCAQLLVWSMISRQSLQILYKQVLIWWMGATLVDNLSKMCSWFLMVKIDAFSMKSKQCAEVNIRDVSEPILVVFHIIFLILTLIWKSSFQVWN